VFLKVYSISFAFVNIQFWPSLDEFVGVQVLLELVEGKSVAFFELGVLVFVLDLQALISKMNVLIRIV